MSVVTGARTIRLSLREIRELPYRALRVAGLAHGEALAAAECVAFAELHRGDGLTQLAAACEGASDAATTPLAFDRADDASRTTYRVRAAAPLESLRHGVPLVELAVGAGRPCLVAAPPMPADSLLDLPLARAAASTGRAVAAVSRAGVAARVRIAWPDGALVAGDAEAVAPTGPIRDALTALAGDRFLLLVLGGPGSEVRRIAPSSGADRRTARAFAAAHGLEADAAAWARVLACAEAYKQPERPTEAAA